LDLFKRRKRDRQTKRVAEGHLGEVCIARDSLADNEFGRLATRGVEAGPALNYIQLGKLAVLVGQERGRSG
jgi:hypothetical protein